MNKNIILSVFLFLFFVTLRAQKAQEIPLQEYSPVGVIPDWVEEKVSVEEFQLWKTMSSVYQVDYNFLKQEISFDKKKSLYEDIVKPLCAAIKKGECQNEKGQLFTINLFSNRDTSVHWEREVLFRINEHIRFCKEKSVIYQAKNAEKTDLECSIWYTYDTIKEECHILKCDIVSIAPFSSFNPVLNVSYEKESKWISVNYVGCFYYLDKLKNEQSVSLRGDFVLKLE